MQANFICPSSRQPSFKAVTLYPCACKVNKSVISDLIKERIEIGWRMQPESICPVDPKHPLVKKALVDPFVRNIAKQVFKENYFDYPGEKAVMEHAEGNWTPFTDTSGLCRKMILKSTTPGSLLPRV